MRVVRWQGGDGGRVVRWWGGRFLVLFKVEDAGWIEDFIFLFLVLMNYAKEQDVLKIFLRGRRDEKILLRSCRSC